MTKKFIVLLPCGHLQDLVINDVSEADAATTDLYPSRVESGEPASTCLICGAWERGRDEWHPSPSGDPVADGPFLYGWHASCNP